MARQQILAARLYYDVLSLKRMGPKDLLRRKNRDEVMRTLSEMQLLTACMGLDEITDEQVEIILSELSKRAGEDLSETAAALKEASPNADTSETYRGLLFRMHRMLTACQRELSAREKGYARRAQTYMLAFHNLPRAFLSVSDRARISPEEAERYADSYLKNM